MYKNQLNQQIYLKNSSNRQKSKLIRKYRKICYKLYDKFDKKKLPFVSYQSCFLIFLNIGFIDHETFIQLFPLIDIINHYIYENYMIIQFINMNIAQKYKELYHVNYLNKQLIFVEYIDQLFDKEKKTENNNAIQLNNDNIQLPYITLENFKNLKNKNVMQKNNPIPGLYIIKDFITKEEELNLLQTFKKYPWDKRQLRHVQHYGYIFEYDTNLPILPTYTLDQINHLKQEQEQYKNNNCKDNKKKNINHII